MREAGGQGGRGGQVGRSRMLMLGLLAFVVVCLAALGGNRKAIARTKAAAADLADQRDSLLTVVRRHTREQAVLKVERDSNQALAQSLRDSVDALERDRSAAQLSVREIRSVGALQARLRKAFPELGKASWGVTTIPIEKGDTIGIEYLMVPAWFAETFVIDHANAKSWKAQKNKLLTVDSLRLRVTALQDSILRLEAANSLAYRAGYESAYNSYQDISKRYVAELKKPRFGLGSTLGVIVGAGAGIVLGGVIHD